MEDPCYSGAGTATTTPKTTQSAAGIEYVLPKRKHRQNATAEMILAETQARSYLPKQIREKRSATVSPKKDPYGALSPATLSPLARPASARTSNSIRTSTTTLGLHAVLSAKPHFFKSNMKKSFSDFVLGCKFLFLKG